MELVALVVSGLVVGLLGRLAVPGPDPMPWWLTIVVGLGGVVTGGLVFALLFGTGFGFIGSVIGASLLIYVYRRVVQSRGMTGSEAKAPPTRGFGLRRRRMRQLEELRDAGVLTPEEFAEKQRQLGA